MRILHIYISVYAPYFDTNYVKLRQPLNTTSHEYITPQFSCFSIQECKSNILTKLRGEQISSFFKKETKWLILPRFLQDLLLKTSRICMYMNREFPIYL